MSSGSLALRSGSLRRTAQRLERFVTGSLPVARFSRSRPRFSFSRDIAWLC
jgi:hypothetical protein